MAARKPQRFAAGERVLAPEADQLRAPVLFLWKGAVKIESAFEKLDPPIVFDLVRAPAIVAPRGAASVVALRASTGAIFPLSELGDLSKEVNHATADFVHATVRCVDRLLAGSVDERLERVLEDLADRYGAPINGGKFIALPLRRKDLARMVGVTLESASRVLARFEREGKIRSKREGIWLKS